MGKMIFNSRTLVLVVWTCLFARGLQAQDSASVRIVPRPVEAVAVAGTFHITSSTVERFTLLRQLWCRWVMKD